MLPSRRSMYRNSFGSLIPFDAVTLYVPASSGEKDLTFSADLSSWLFIKNLSSEELMKIHFKCLRYHLNETVLG